MGLVAPWTGARRRRAVPSRGRRELAGGGGGLVQERRTGTLLDCPNMDAFWFAPMHRVILHYTNWVEDNDVAVRIRRAVPNVPKDHARNAALQARISGHAIVLTAAPDIAEDAATNLRAQGLRVTLEEA